MEGDEKRQRFIWVKEHQEVLLLGFAVLVVAQIVLQFFYPYDKSLPNASLYGQPVGGVARDELAKQVSDAFLAAQVELQTPTTSYTAPLSSFGTSVDANDAASQLAFYPVWQRLLPLSVYWATPEISRFSVKFSDSELQKSAKKAAKKLSSQPVNAGLAIEKGDLVVTNAKNGESVSAKQVTDALQTATLTPSTETIAVQSVSEEPAVPDASIAAVRQQAESILGHAYTFQYENGSETTAKKADIATWLKIVTKGSDLRVVADKKGIAGYIARLNKTVAVAGTPTYIKLVDGEQVSKKVGKSGSTIDTEDLTGKIEDAIKSDESTVMAVIMKPVAPKKSYNRSYTSSQKGLQAYADYLAEEEDIKISVLQLSGKRWYANGGAYDSVVSASTYKLYVAAWVANQIKTNKMKLGDKMLDTTVEGCLERMIVVSDNACAEAWVKKAGGSGLNNFLYSKGISTATTFIASDATHTSTSDLQKVLLGIWNGTMISGSLQSKITGYMGRQVYRQGIPAGSDGKVYDKVGFLWDYLNDAAIVVHPKGTYSLAIMTKGSSWGHIAEITRQVEKIMYS